MLKWLKRKLIRKATTRNEPKLCKGCEHLDWYGALPICNSIKGCSRVRKAVKVDDTSNE